MAPTPSAPNVISFQLLVGRMSALAWRYKYSSSTQAVTKQSLEEEFVSGRKEAYELVQPPYLILLD